MVFKLEIQSPMSTSVLNWEDKRYEDIDLYF